jgi:dipeptidyl aminopeptidase/acylaminoacyl peptidase
MTLDDLWRFDRLASPSLSPDGRSAVCTVTCHDLAQNQGRTDLWLMPTEGATAPRRLTTASGRPSQPAWSPLGDRVAFLSSREQQGQRDTRPQLYVIAADGGEAVRRTELTSGIEAFRWLPHGHGVLFSAWVWPDLKGRRAQDRQWHAWEQRKETGFTTDASDYRHWDHNHPMGRVLHLHLLDLRSGRVTDLFEGTPYRLPRDDLSPNAFDSSPDGRRVAFMFDPSPEPVTNSRETVVEMTLATREVRVLADEGGWDFAWPRYAPDGRWLAVVASHVGLQHTMPGKPALIDLAGRVDRTSRANRGGRAARDTTWRPAWHPLGDDWDHEVASPLCWAPDGRSLYLCAEHQGRRPLWRCQLEAETAPSSGSATDTHTVTGRFEVVTSGGWVQAFALAGTAAAPTIVALQDSQCHPPQLFVLRTDRPVQRLDRFNDRRLAELQMGHSETVTLQGALGEPVQMWLTYPPGFDPRRRHPVMHVIHGGPYAASGDTWSWRWNTQLLASRGHVVAQVNYHGSSGFGHDFKRSIMGRMAQLEHQDIEAGTDWLRGQPWVDPTRIYATGGSYGGFMVAWINGHSAAGRYRAHICHAGVFDRVATFAADSWASRRKDLGHWYWDNLDAVLAQSPHAHAAHMNTPTLVIHGALDYRVPDCNGLAYYNTLKARGIDARLLWFPDENHWVLKPRNSQQWHTEFFAWLERHGGRRRGRSSADRPRR